MVKKTNLTKCKEIAKNMLDTIPPKEVKINGKKTKISPFVIEFFNSFNCSAIPIYKELLKKYNVSIFDREAMLEDFEYLKVLSTITMDMIIPIPNLYVNKNLYLLAKISCKQIIDNITKFKNFSDFVREQYALDFLQEVEQFISPKDFSEYLVSAYTYRNDILKLYNISNVVLSLDERLKLESNYLESFRQIIPQFAMDKEDLHIYNNFDEEITIYRGLSEYNKEHIKGLSWTIDKNIAKNRFGNVFIDENGTVQRVDENPGSTPLDGYVYKAKINKKDIFAYCNERNEQEVIVDYTKLYDIEQIEHIKA